MKLKENEHLFNPTGKNDIKYIILTLTITSALSILSGLLLFFLHLNNKLYIDIFFILTNILTIGVFMLCVNELHKINPFLFITLGKKISFILILKWIIVSIFLFVLAFIILTTLSETKFTINSNITILPLISGILYFIVIVFKEEIIFRGYLLQETSLYAKKIVSIIIIAVLFTLYHIFRSGIYGLIVIFLWGLIYGWITFTFKRLEYVIAIHFGINIMTWATENMLEADFNKIFYFKLNILCLVFLSIITLIIKKRTSLKNKLAL